jgi:hypothetical protein
MLLDWGVTGRTMIKGSQCPCKRRHGLEGLGFLMSNETFIRGMIARDRFGGTGLVVEDFSGCADCDIGWGKLGRPLGTRADEPTTYETSGRLIFFSIRQWPQKSLFLISGNEGGYLSFTANQKQYQSNHLSVFLLGMFTLMLIPDNRVISDILLFFDQNFVKYWGNDSEDEKSNGKENETTKYSGEICSWTEKYELKQRICRELKSGMPRKMVTEKDRQISAKSWTIDPRSM